MFTAIVFVMSDGRARLREVSRNAVRAQIGKTAEELFIANGFDETTVEEIAAEVGMSQRSFFRYFASKDEVVLNNYERLGDDLIGHLRSRPLDESEWDSLRRSFDLMVEEYSDDERRNHGAAIQRIIDSSPTLLAGFLKRMNQIQQRLTDELETRAAERGDAPDSIVLRAMVGAAFACLHAAISDVVTSNQVDRIGSRLDLTMTVLRPCGQT